MKLTISQQLLKRALTKVVAFTPTKSATDYLVRFSYDQPNLLISSTMPEGTIQTTITNILTEDTAETDNHFSVNGKLINDIVSGADGETLNLDHNAEDNILTISTDASEWSIPLTKAAVRLPERGERKTGITTPEFIEALRKVRYAVGNEPSRPYLMMVDISAGRARATNGQTYSENTVGNEDLNVSIFYSMIGPLIEWLQRYADREVELFESAINYTFVVDNDSVSLVKRNLQFPDLDNLWVRGVKAGAASVLLVNRRALLSSLNRVKLLTDKDSPLVEVCIEGHKTTLKCKRKSGAEAITSLDSQWGAAARVATFDINALILLVKSNNQETVELRFGPDTRQAKSPIVLQGDNTWSMLTQMIN